MKNAVEVTADNFESEVLNSNEPVLVDLYATWCPPCRAMAQVLDQVAPQLEGRVKVVKINTDHEPELAGAFQVSSIPTIAMIQKGRIVDLNVGLMSPAQVLQMVDRAAGA